MITLYDDILGALKAGIPFVIATVVEAKGSTPRKCGAKMLIYADGSTQGTVGGGKFESLVIDQAQEVRESGELALKSFPLHERAKESFGAICGGEVTILLEPYKQRQRLIISGAGHCGQALASLAKTCDWAVIIVDDRAELFESEFYQEAANSITYLTESHIFQNLDFRESDAVVLISRGHPEDRAALNDLLARTPRPKLAYLGMVGSRRKVNRVMAEMRTEGISAEAIEQVYAPLGLDIGSESPAEIAISIMAEILQVTRGATGGHMRTV